MGDGSCPTLFEVPDQPFDSRIGTTRPAQIALEADRKTLDEMLARGGAAGHRDPRDLRPRLHRRGLLA
jgi:hypothetical protein